jgi:Fe-S-cluster containining protein
MSSMPLQSSSLLLQADHWFDRSHAALLHELPCRRGCHHCCIGPFPVTALDADALAQGLPSLSQSDRADIAETARRQCAMMEAAFPQLQHAPFLDAWIDESLDQLADQFAALPCPALDSNGCCRVYPFRPLTCRMMGIPVEENGVTRGACEVQIAVPITRLPRVLREEEHLLAAREATELERSMATSRAGGTRAGEEVLLPYAFLPGRVR